MRRVFIAILVFAFLGLVSSVIMTQMHWRLEGHGFQSRSFCNISELVDCDTALASSYSKIQGIPTAQLGVAYYLFFILATFLAWLSEEKRQKILSFFLLGSVGATLYSLTMATISIFHLKVLCLLCLTTYVTNIAHLFLIPRGLMISLSRLPSYLGDCIRAIFGKGIRIAFWPQAALFLLVVVGLLFFIQGLNPQGLGPEGRMKKIAIPDDLYLKRFYSLPAQELKPPDSAAAWGDPKSPVTIVEFSDFQCPFCRRAAFSLKPYLGEYRHKVRFVFMNYPLDDACNPAIQRRFHPVACLTAKAVLCAGEKGKLWEYHDRVFENQERLSRSALIEIVKEVGLEEAWLNACLLSGEVEGRLQAEIQEGNRIGIQETPTVFINGCPFRDWTDPERLRLIVGSELAPAAPPPIDSTPK